MSGRVGLLELAGTPNHPAAGKAGTASVLAFVHRRPGLPEPGRLTLPPGLGGLLSRHDLASRKPCSEHKSRPPNQTRDTQRNLRTLASLRA
jgi:hypothetical protein